jgi:hypothetical protein
MSTSKNIVYVTNYGVPTTGLTLTWESLVNVITGVAVTPQPAFTELGGGFYTFELNVPLSSYYSGVIDASSTIEIDSERYIAVAIGSEDGIENIEVIVTPYYDENSDAVTLTTYLKVNGRIYETPTSAEVNIYDTTHTLLLTSTGSTSDNGVFILSESEPGFTAGASYYAISEITVGTNTYKSIETMISLE